MQDYISEFQGGLNDLVVFFKSISGLQPSSSNGGSGVCLYPSQTAKDVSGATAGVYGISILDFLFLACIWPWIRAPVMAITKR